MDLFRQGYDENRKRIVDLNKIVESSRFFEKYIDIVGEYNDVEAEIYLAEASAYTGDLIAARRKVDRLLETEKVENVGTFARLLALHNDMKIHLDDIESMISVNNKVLLNSNFNKVYITIYLDSLEAAAKDDEIISIVTKSEKVNGFDEKIQSYKCLALSESSIEIANQCFLKMFEHDKNMSIDTYMYLLSSLLELNKIRSFKEVFGSANQLFKGVLDIALFEGQLFLKQKKYNKALKVFNKLESISPEDYWEVGPVLYRFRKKAKLAEAEVLYYLNQPRKANALLEELFLLDDSDLLKLEVKRLIEQFNADNRTPNKTEE